MGTFEWNKDTKNILHHIQFISTESFSAKLKIMLNCDKFWSPLSFCLDEECNCKTVCITKKCPLWQIITQSLKILTSLHD
jgi:hypothetical protein